MSQPKESVLLNRWSMVFLMCCDLKNFSKVGQAVGLSQSAVSKIIKNYEERLGFELFVRDSRPLVVTPEGVLLQKFLRKVLGEGKHFLSDIQTRNFKRPILKLGILESLSLTLGTEIVRELLPDLNKIFLITASANVLMQRLQERKLDLVITHGNYGENTELIFRRKIFEEPSILLFPKSSPVLPGEEVSWKRLSTIGLPQITYWKETGAGQVNDLFLRTHDFNFPEKLVVDTNALMVRLVSQGFGWAITRPTTVLECYSELNDLTVARMSPPVLKREVFLVGREDECLEEGEILTDLSRKYFKSSIVPKISQFAPWVTSAISIANQ